jgi:hypothetical protein
MKKDIKQKWVKALRSGRYKQCTEELCNGTGYCCLGVLAQISGSKKDDIFNFLKRMNNKDYRLSKDAELLSNKFLKEVGMKKSTQENLANMNDDGSSFEEIADYIEKTL